MKLVVGCSKSGLVGRKRILVPWYFVTSLRVGVDRIVKFGIINVYLKRGYANNRTFNCQCGIL